MRLRIDGGHRPALNGPRSALALAGLVLLAGAIGTAGARSPVRAGAWALPPFIRQAVIPAPGVDFVRGADLNGDGRPDFVGRDTVYDRGTGNPTEVRLTWWRQEAPEAGEPAGQRFAEQPTLSGASRDPELLLGAGDLDGDGHQDLLTVEPTGQVSAWLNEDGSASFPQRRSGGRVLSGAAYIEVANLDADTGDRRDDLLLVREGRDLSWYPSQGAVGQIDLGPAQTLIRGSQASKLVAVATGDIDGDGLLDLVTATDKTGDTIAWWRQRLDGQDRVFDPIGEGDEADVRDLSLGDIDGDGDADILVTSQVGNQPYQVYAWLNAGDGKTFERQAESLQTSATKDHKWNAIDVLDVDGDGALDFVASEFTLNSNSGHLCWYENPGPAAPTAEPTTGLPSPTPANPTAPPTAAGPSPSPGGPSPTPSPPDPTATPDRTPAAPSATPTRVEIIADDWLYLPRLIRW